MSAEANTKQQAAAEKPYLVVFYGTECPHCIEMEPLLARLKAETGLDYEHLEVWHSAKNDQTRQGLDKSSTCGGVPFFYNRKSCQTLCGTVSYERLKQWALNRLPEACEI
ncbi:MAG: hypothetical protein A2788_01770 [Candidatus Abawacabacteria bacterium RIFCSPHIGHO2_01_FULL_46_8]|uniref:Thioredoxin domain-containing protein n=1 Tax=Candidatus Abawacabacteria bacterium RIFCSPHIGHO2_01_FULL_46_8 TaxID=1817815 RepID=A0A1F4XIZ0_9BACT|nr:MAG: hypothetical protein A2788_01770 [Candidatus Abawacabacteria bacterium RIFCSPHIGHO2_01_FULL_46_8]